MLAGEDSPVLSAVLHEARAAALASSTSTADGDVELSLLEVCCGGATPTAPSLCTCT